MRLTKLLTFLIAVTWLTNPLTATAAEIDSLDFEKNIDQFEQELESEIKSYLLLTENNKSPEKKQKPEKHILKKSRKRKPSKELTSLTSKHYPHIKKMSKLTSTGKDADLYLSGYLREDAFIYNRVRTLRSDYDDQNGFIRHKLHLDFFFEQGKQKYEGKPVSEAFVRLTNYMFWQEDSHYTPIITDDINLPTLDNVSIAKDLHVKNLIPLLFVEQAWLRLHFDKFIRCFKKNKTFLQIGLFPYTVGRGITLGYHEDLAIDYLGFAGEGGFNRYPSMPPGILLRTELLDNLSLDLYYMKWREVNQNMTNILKPTREHRLSGPRPHRGKGKDTDVWIARLDYNNYCEDWGSILAQPYWVYVNAPEQAVEFLSDASSQLHTLGMMVDYNHLNLSFNIEVAGQFGHQDVHGIDRNTIELTKKGNDGNVCTSFSHVFLDNSKSRSQAPVGRKAGSLVSTTANDVFDPQNQLKFIVQQPHNRNVSRQGQAITNIGGTNVKVETMGHEINLFNSDTFGNARFRKPYRLNYSGFMALADTAYEFDDLPLRIAATAAHISGDNYPYNNECNDSYRGFVPLKSRYKGMGVQNFLFFDRLIIPRPLNISHRNLYAFNDQRSLTNLQFIGFGLTWFPLNERKKMALTTDIMWLWKAASQPKWDNLGKHPDAAREAEIAVDRQRFNFKGWESTQHARRMLGTELDIKFYYHMLDHCRLYIKTAFFFPGGLYKDTQGQPNIVTIRKDACGFDHYDSLGHDMAFAFVTGLNYTF